MNQKPLGYMVFLNGGILDFPGDDMLTENARYPVPEQSDARARVALHIGYTGFVNDRVPTFYGGDWPWEEREDSSMKLQAFDDTVYTIVPLT